MKWCILVTTIICLTAIVPSSALRCLECFGVSTEAECNDKGKIRECRFNQDACEIELREHEGWGGHILMYKQCKQSWACDNNYVQNPRSAWMPSQCNPEDFNSVCRCCCYEDLCNVRRDSCFGTPGCASPPNYIHRGSISCTNGRNYASSCVVTCDSNSKLVGVSTSYCRYDGAWSFPFAQCQDIQCPQRITIENGWFICTNSQFAGSQCTAECRPGFTLQGPKISSCLNTGSWNYREPRCVPNQCDDRGTVAGGVVTCSDGRNLQSRCRVECEGFRRLTGIMESYCEDRAQWSHELPTCELIQCPIRGSILHGTVSCSLGVDVTSECQAICDEGYASDGPVNSICLPSGNWNQPLPSCSRIQCPKRGTVEYGDVGCTDLVYSGSVCSVICFEGSRMIGSDVSECLPSGKWSFPLPKCERVQCPERGSIENGVVSCNNKRYVNSVCTAKCNRGSQLVGLPTSTCTPDGFWSNPLPSCPRIICPALDFSAEGIMTCTDDFFYDSTCSFTCDARLRLVGAPRVRCQISGLWTSRLPECRPITCLLRGRISNGVVTCSDSNNLDSVCDATCNAGYRLSGPPSSECLLSGRWSTRLPTCRPIKCPLRGVISGGSVTCTKDNVYGSVCSTTCNGGFELNGQRISSCEDTGFWDFPLPQCESRPCNDQGELEHGRISCTDSSNIQSICTFSCQDEGYEIYPRGRTRNVCQRNQRWNFPKPCCSRPCPPYALMDIVLVLDSSSSIGTENWFMLTEFVRGIIRTFRVDADAANFAIFRYNAKVDEGSQIMLNSFPNDIEGLVGAFNEIIYDGSGTFTGRALNHALTVSLAPGNGNRPGVKDVVFVITDGKAADDVKTPADNLRKNGAVMLVLGIEPPKGALDVDQLRDIAGSEQNLVIAEGGFAGLNAEFGIKLSRTICGKPCE